MDCPEDRPYICVVFDGMGGEAHGEVASLFASKNMQTMQDKLSGVKDADSLKDYLEEFRIKTTEDISSYMKEKDQEELYCGSTCAGVYINEEKLIPFWLGDSRIYRWRTSEKKLEMLSKDDTQAQEWIDQGLMDEEYARATGLWHVLTAFLGNQNDKIRIGEEIKLSEDDMILICSDGITDLLLNNTLEKLFKQYPDQVDGILKEVAKTWADDNCTAIIIS
ncbi:MAG: serine/threonine-protein phosphatase [Lachnospiraceae bacterium]|nr:serine/threonine-protein phosphatase [Lachnospiraceae bacterium]